MVIEEYSCLVFIPTLLYDENHYPKNYSSLLHYYMLRTTTLSENLHKFHNKRFSHILYLDLS